MGKIIYITGGARSGKSSFGEKLAKSFDKNKIYIATSKIWDEEMQDRVEKHKIQRGTDWITLEAHRDLDKVLEEYQSQEFVVLLDCVTNMVSNLMLSEERDWDNINIKDVNSIEKDIQTEIEKLISFAKSFKGTTILVSNELGMGLVPAYPLGRYFRDIAGRINQYLAKESDEAYLIVSGMEVKLK